MAEQPAQDRTEEATPKRLEEARGRGEVSKSPELTSAILLLSTMFYFYFAGELFIHGLADTLVDFYRSLNTIQITPGRMSDLARNVFQRGILIAGPVIMTILLVALLVNYMQVGVIFSTKALVPKWDRINPKEGFKRIFSTKGLVELLKGIFKIFITGMILYVYLSGRVDDYPFLTYMTPLQILGEIATDLFKIGTYVGIALLVMAALDYLYQRWEYQRKLRMTKQEVKDEMKQAEGSPEIKARIRSAMRDLSRNRMMRNVAEATVVITNPTHYAVALKYDETGEVEAPMVVGKGMRKMALRMREVAEANGVPIKESPPLARALYASAEVGDEIPYAYYQAVAEILAEIYWDDQAVA